MPDVLYFEDFPLGEVIEYGGVDVSVDEVIAFARDFDPQPFHTDEEAARAATGGLIASGWHTSALLLKMNCEAFVVRAAVLDEPITAAAVVGVGVVLFGVALVRHRRKPRSNGVPQKA